MLRDDKAEVGFLGTEFGWTRRVLAPGVVLAGALYTLQAVASSYKFKRTNYASTVLSLSSIVAS